MNVKKRKDTSTNGVTDADGNAYGPKIPRTERPYLNDKGIVEGKGGKGNLLPTSKGNTELEPVGRRESVEHP